MIEELALKKESHMLARGRNILRLMTMKLENLFYL